jgi:hypothetical protein
MGSVQNIGGVTLTAGAVPAGSGDLETLLMAICSDRANVLNSVATGQANAMAANNQKIAQLNQVLNDVRASAPSQDKSGQTPSPAISDADKAILSNVGINYGDYVGTDGKTKADGGWGNLMEAVKTQIDGLSSTSQLDMIKLQSSINKSNQAIDMMTNLVQKFSDTRDKIIGNIR